MDFEDRLRAWGAAQASAVGVPPPVALVVRRRWVPVAAAAAVVAIVGTAAALTLRPQHRVTPAQPPAGVVPWADLPAQHLPGPEATTPPVGPARPCQVADLRATGDPGQGGTGNWFVSLALTNISASPCLLTGRLDGLSGVNAGVRRAIHVSHEGGAYGQQVAPVVLRPGASGEVLLDWYQRCDVTQPPTPTGYSALRLSLLGGTLDVAGDGLALGCDPPSTGVHASALGGQPAEPTPLPDPRRALVASVRLPASARAGEVLRYTVVLTNPTGTDIALDPCPDISQVIPTLAKRLTQLNCPAAGPVPAGGSETFAMELAVPRTAASGTVQLVWLLDVLGSPAFGEVTVTGGEPGPTPTPANCEVPSTGPPCEPGMVPGQAYPFRLYDHCGVRGLRADGQDWVPEVRQAADGNPPAGFGNPYDEGTVVLDKPDALLTYRSSGGVVVQFRPRVPTDPAEPICS